MDGYEYETNQRKCSYLLCKEPTKKRRCVLCTLNGCETCAKHGNSVRRYCRDCFNTTHNTFVKTRLAEAATKRWQDLRAESYRAPETLPRELDHSKRLCLDMQPRALVSSRDPLADLKLLLAASSLHSSPEAACKITDERSCTYSVEIVDHIGESGTLNGHGGHLSHKSEYTGGTCDRCKSKVVWGSWLSYKPSQPFRVLCAACYETGHLGNFEYHRTHVTSINTKCLQTMLQQHRGEKIEVSLAYQPLAAGTKDICFSSLDIKVGWNCLRLAWHAWPYICNISKHI